MSRRGPWRALDWLWLGYMGLVVGSAAFMPPWVVTVALVTTVTLLIGCLVSLALATRPSRETQPHKQGEAQ